MVLIQDEDLPPHVKFEDFEDLKSQLQYLTKLHFMGPNTFWISKTGSLVLALVYPD